MLVAQGSLGVCRGEGRPHSSTIELLLWLVSLIHLSMDAIGGRGRAGSASQRTGFSNCSAQASLTVAHRLGSCRVQT